MNKLVFELALKTTELLRAKQYKLNRIEWVRGEANLDVEFSRLACQCCETAWMQFVDSHPGVTLLCVGPDINLTFCMPDETIVYKKIELKSSTSRQIPGSTVSEMDVNQPVIYCLRPSKTRPAYELRCSLYHEAIKSNQYALFQDRTPRPRISFDQMCPELPYKELNNDCWIDNYAKSAVERLHHIGEIPPSWQDELTNRIIDHYLRTTTLKEIRQRKSRTKC